MNKELLEQLTPLVDLAKDGIFKAVEVAQEQFPILVEEILKWEFTSSLIWCLMSIPFLIGAIYGTIQAYKICKREDMWDFMPFCIFMYVPGVMMVAFNMSWLHILVAPKLFLFKYLTNLM